MMLRYYQKEKISFKCYEMLRNCGKATQFFLPF